MEKSGYGEPRSKCIAYIILFIRKILQSNHTCTITSFCSLPLALMIVLLAKSQSNFKEFVYYRRFCIKRYEFDTHLEIEDRKQNFVTNRLLGAFKKAYPLLPLYAILTLVA
jgi:hypothetical protein